MISEYLSLCFVPLRPFKNIDVVRDFAEIVRNFRQHTLIVQIDGMPVPALPLYLFPQTVVAFPLHFLMAVRAENRQFDLISRVFLSRIDRTRPFAFYSLRFFKIIAADDLRKPLFPDISSVVQNPFEPCLIPSDGSGHIFDPSRIQSRRYGRQRSPSKITSEYLVYDAALFRTDHGFSAFKGIAVWNRPVLQSENTAFFPESFPSGKDRRTDRMLSAHCCLRRSSPRSARRDPRRIDCSARIPK